MDLHDHCDADKIVIVNQKMKSGRPPFIRDDQSHTRLQTWKKNILGFGLLLIPIRLFLIFFTLFLYWGYLKVLRFFCDVGLYSEKTRQAIARVVASPGARFLLYCCAVCTITRYYVTEEQLARLREELERERAQQQEKESGISTLEASGNLIAKENGTGAGAGAGDDDSVVDPAVYRMKDPYIIVSNHISFFDPAIIIHEMGECSFVAKSDVEKWPIIGILMGQLKGLFAGKGGVVEQIKQRVKHYYAHEHERSKLIIFPEGTTTNGNYMLHFHDGAFLPGVPVQPIVHRFRYKYFCPGWVGSERHYFQHLFSQLNNDLHIVHFPPYYPTPEERRDPQLYANNVRRAMVELSNFYLEKKLGKLHYACEKFYRNLKCN